MRETPCWERYVVAWHTEQTGWNAASKGRVWPGPMEIPPFPWVGIRCPVRYPKNGSLGPHCESGSNGDGRHPSNPQPSRLYASMSAHCGPLRQVRELLCTAPRAECTRHPLQVSAGLDSQCCCRGQLRVLGCPSKAVFGVWVPERGGGVPRSCKAGTHSTSSLGRLSWYAKK